MGSSQHTVRWTPVGVVFLVVVGMAASLSWTNRRAGSQASQIVVPQMSSSGVANQVRGAMFESFDALSPAEKVGLVFAVPVSSASAEVLNAIKPGFVGLFDVSELDPGEVTALILEIDNEATRNNRVEPMVFVDQEGGRVQRLMRGFTKIPSFEESCATLSEEELEFLGKSVAKELVEVGVDGVWAPVADRTLSESKVLSTRTCSDDPEELKVSVGAYMSGLAGGGLIPVIKHYPGLGNTGTDPHLSLGQVDHSDEEVFMPLIDIAQNFPNGFGVMVTHVSIHPDKLPCTLSRFCIQLLEHSWKSSDKALIFSDALEMKGITSVASMKEAAYQGILAGLDVLVFGDPQRQSELVMLHRSLVELYGYDEVFSTQVDRAVERIMRFRGEVER